MPGESDFGAAIELVNHETRAEILVALAEHQRDRPHDPALRFSELRRRVGHDDPGNFNYHLSRLQGNLVEKTGEGYRLSNLGAQFVGLLVSGKFDADTQREFPDDDSRCPVCDAETDMTYDDGVLQVACGNGHTANLDVGPGLLEGRPIAEALNIAIRRNLFDVMEFIDGICPDCEGETSGELRNPDDERIDVLYQGVCTRCGTIVQSPGGACVLFDPAVVSLCADHGLDVRRDAWTIVTRHLQRASMADDGTAVVEVAIDDDELTVYLDRSGRVTEVDES